VTWSATAAEQRIQVHSALFYHPETHADRLVLYFLTYEYSWGQLMGYGFLFCSLPDASSLLQLGPVQKLGWGRTD
jgi:hypothetical protein